MMQRRTFMQAGAAGALAGCHPDEDRSAIAGGFTGIQVERGHWLRDALQSGKPWPAPVKRFTTEVLIAGGGVAGLAAARALRLQGRNDFALLELEDQAGGNSRAGAIDGLACPLGAHYLPVPGEDAPEVQDLLEELGLRQRVAGRWVYDERHLCHSPQERLFIDGAWQEGLLPVRGIGPATLAQYRQFGALVERLRKAARWTIPWRMRPDALIQTRLSAITFIAYLDQNGLTDRHLRWYLDYCCRDDYGAGIATVSAWAGIHYFASRHGFHAPGGDAPEHEGLLTWPEGNAWLTRRLASPLGERLFAGRVVVRMAANRHGVEVDAFNAVSQSMERWQARRAIVALPLHIAARVVQNPPEFLRQAAQTVVYAPWLVANLHLRAPLHDRPGPAPSWDNVLYGDSATAPGLGYVDAGHQSLRSTPGATVLTYYRALGDVPGGPAAGRQWLLHKPWSLWRDEIVAELAQAHPDLPSKVSRMDITRYGHAMALPVPRMDGHMGLYPSRNRGFALSKKEHGAGFQGAAWERLRFAHSDWSGYSVFEEAFTAGHTCAT